MADSDSDGPGWNDPLTKAARASSADPAPRQDWNRSENTPRRGEAVASYVASTPEPGYASPKPELESPLLPTRYDAPLPQPPAASWGRRLAILLALGAVGGGVAAAVVRSSPLVEGC